jgi:hypothetical protein
VLPVDGGQRFGRRRRIRATNNEARVGAYAPTLGDGPALARGVFTCRRQKVLFCRPNPVTPPVTTCPRAPAPAAFGRPGGRRRGWPVPGRNRHGGLAARRKRWEDPPSSLYFTPRRGPPRAGVNGCRWLSERSNQSHLLFLHAGRSAARSLRPFAASARALGGLVQRLEPVAGVARLRYYLRNYCALINVVRCVCSRAHLPG